MINNKTTRECLVILLQYMNGDYEKIVEMLHDLMQVKGNQSFHDSIVKLYDLAKMESNLP